MPRLGETLDCVTFRDGAGAETSTFRPVDGDGPGVPVFLAPALGLDGRSFALLAPACAGRRTIFWNTPNRLPLEGGLTAFADLAVEHADRAGLTGGFVFGGSSLGGMIALTAAARHPDRVRGLILFGVAPRWGALGPWIRAASHLHGVVPRRKYHRLLARVMFPGGAHPILDPLRDQMRHRTKAHLTSVLAALRSRGGFDLRPLIEQVRAPVLVVQGRRDPVARLRGTRAYAAFGTVETVVLDDARHLPFLQEPEPVNAAVSRFLTRIDQETAS